MNNFQPITLTRQQLAEFLPNHDSIKEFERLFAQDTELSILVGNIIVSVGLDEDGNYIVRSGSNYLDSSTTIYEDSTILDGVINDVTVGAGLNQDGSYIQNALAHYISAAISLGNADDLLDEAIFDETRDFIINVTGSASLLASNQLVLCDATGGPQDINLPDPSLSFSDDRSYKIGISKIDITVNEVTVLPFASESIVGEISQIMNSEGDILNFITDGTNWYLGA